MRQLAEALALAGAQVHALCTSGCENADPLSHLATTLARAGQPLNHASAPGTWLHWTDRGVSTDLLVTVPARRHHWCDDWGDRFDARYLAVLEEASIDVVITFGQDAADMRRWAWARQRGCRVVRVMHNQSAIAESGANEVDEVWAPSHDLAGRYEQAWSRPVWVCSTAVSALPEPDAADVFEPSAPPRAFVTFINPEVAKGADVVAHLVARWQTERPGQPVLIVEGRAGAMQWQAALARAGVAPRSCPQVFVAPVQDDLSAIWAASKVVLMPSLVDEAAGRVALEAMGHGVVPLVSNRGALPETVQHADWVLPLPCGMSWRQPGAVPPSVTDTWAQGIAPYLDDEARWRQASARARVLAQRHRLDRIGPACLQRLQALVAA